MHVTAMTGARTRNSPARRSRTGRAGLSRFTRLLAACGLASVSVTGSAAAQFTPFEAAIADFDAELASGVAKNADGCYSIAVFIGDEVIWSKGYGWADIENTSACSEETIGRVGSISKSFTAVAMMQLVERGIIGLDDPVADYLPEIEKLAEPPEGMSPITFRMLASHTAGLEREPNLRGAGSGSAYKWEEKLLESIPTTYFKMAPGAEYSYSNIGYGILGLACSRAAGVPFMTLVEDQIFRPLDMYSSAFVINTPEFLARLSVGYERDDQTGELGSEQATREHFGRGYRVPTEGIYSTVGDLAKLAAAMMGASSTEILSKESRTEMLTPQPPAEMYGLGFQLGDEQGMRLAGHGGSVAGYDAGVVFDRDSKIGIAILRTTSYNPSVLRLLEKLVAARR